MQKKILVFHPIIAPYRIDFFNSLSIKYDTTICLFWRNLKDQTFDYEEISSRFKFIPKYLVREESGTLRWIRAIWRELSSNKPNIVYTCEYGIATILILLHRFITGAKYKVVTTTDDSYNMLTANNHFTARHKYAVGILAPFVDEVQTVEPRVELWYKNKYHKGVCFPIICDDVIARERQKRVLTISEQYVTKYGLEGQKILLFVGRLVVLKNIDFAIKAFEKADIPNSKFIIVGSGKQEPYLRGVAGNNSKVLFVGRFEGDELYAWYNIANIFTLQSIQESFGAVTNEALVAGCKCLISKDAGSNCLIKEGVNGYLIDPYNEEDYISKLIILMNEEKPVSLPLDVKINQMQETFLESITKLTDKLDSL